MNMPTIAFSRNEGSALSKYHSILVTPELGYKYFMPRSEDELSTLYNMCTLGRINSQYGFSPSGILSIDISENIKEEFLHRCQDGHKEIIDEFLLYFGKFVKIIDEFKDPSFLEELWMKSPINLYAKLVSFAGNLEYSFKDSCLTRESTHLPYTVCEIDKILNASRKFQDVKLAEFYRTHYLTDEFHNSPEYQAMYSAIAGTFEEGISITDLCTKE
jgi:hypothetical protein